MKRLLWGFVLGSFFLFYSLGQSLGQSAPPKKTPELLAKGKKLYEQNCMPCHGPREMERALLALSSSLLPEISIYLLVSGLIPREISRRFLRSFQREFPIQQWEMGPSLRAGSVGIGLLCGRLCNYGRRKRSKNHRLRD